VRHAITQSRKPALTSINPAPYRPWTPHLTSHTLH